MAEIITIILFLTYFWGLGYTALYFLKKPDHAGERHLLYLAIGLGIFPILAILLNFLHLPLDWKLFLALSLIFPVGMLARKIQKKEFTFPSFQFNFKLTKSSLCLAAVLIIFAFSLFMYTKGALSYPYLEDEDPWGHSVGAKYVALEKNAYDPLLSEAEGAEGAEKIDPVLSYIDPYPPAYDILMGILHQTSPNLPWTLKFFNALIISLGFIFFYLFAKELIGSRSKAVVATFIFASIPSYLSHFIWAHALAVTLFFPTIYAFLNIKNDKRWAIVAGILVASIWVSQNIDQPLKMTTMIIIFLVVYSAALRKIDKEGFLAVFGGITLSLLWWGVMVQKYTLQGFINYFGANVISAEGAVAGMNNGGASSGFFASILSVINTATNPGGSASRAYTFNDFFIARSENMINNPVGIGVIISILTLCGMGYLLWKYKQHLVTTENAWRSVALFWLIFAFWGVNGMTFPVSVAKGAFRVWLLLAIPVALIAMEGFYALKNISNRKMIGGAIAIILILGILLTSTQQKYQLNTSVWPTSGSFTGGPMEPFEYGQWFNTIPFNTKVFLYAPRDKLTIGYGAMSCDWCQNVRDFRSTILDKDSTQLYQFLKAEGYEYFIINPGMDARFFNSQFGENKTQELLPKRYEEIINSGKFIPVYQGQNKMFVFKIAP